jgi:hypothetical protein
MKEQKDGAIFYTLCKEGLFFSPPLFMRRLINKEMRKYVYAQ